MADDSIPIVRSMPIGTRSDVRIHCPKCARYIGPIEECPYCHFKVPKKRSYRAMKWGALVWAIVGVLVLQQIYSAPLMEPHFGNPEMKIEEVGRLNNYAYITIEGIVSNTPIFYPRDYYGTGTVYFHVDDGTGDMLVKAYDEVAKEMMADHSKIPQYGDRVRIRGTFQYRSYDFSMILQTVDQMEIFREEAVDMSIADIVYADGDAGLDGLRVHVEGEVDSWKQFDFAMSIYLVDGFGNKVNIWIPKGVTDLSGPGDVFKISQGAYVECEGSLMWYEAGRYSTWEVIPANSGEFRITSEGGG